MTMDAIKKCKQGKNIIFEAKYNIKIRKRIYKVNAYGTKMSDRAVKNYIKTVELIMDKLKDN